MNLFELFRMYMFEKVWAFIIVTAAVFGIVFYYALKRRESPSKVTRDFFENPDNIDRLEETAQNIQDGFINGIIGRKK